MWAGQQDKNKLDDIVKKKKKKDLMSWKNITGIWFFLKLFLFLFLYIVCIFKIVAVSTL